MQSEGHQDQESPGILNLGIHSQARRAGRKRTPHLVPLAPRGAGNRDIGRVRLGWSGVGAPGPARGGQGRRQTGQRRSLEGLRQVLSNLFDNAIRYTPEGGHVNVRIGRYRNGRPSDNTERLELQVRDTGIGIPREALPRIFERFYRVDPARSRADGGTGLGLSIVKHLVERMDGEVSAESELGRGTTIRLRLPAA